MEYSKNQNTVVSTNVLSDVHRKMSIFNELSSDIIDRSNEKLRIINTLSEPVRRLEFNVLVSMFTDLENKSYDSMKLTDNGVKFKTIDTNIIGVSEITKFLTLNYEVKDGYYWFILKNPFINFTDMNYIKSDQLYKRLYSLCISNNLKTLYYFIAKYPYNFISIISLYYKNLYKRLSNIDDFFDSMFYHKRITEKN